MSQTGDDNSGAPGTRYAVRREAFRQGRRGPGADGAVAAHIELYLGEVGQVWHKFVETPLPVDLYMAPATEERPFKVLVTAGMSDQPMPAPPDAQGCRHMELVLCLPESWPLGAEALRDEKNAWPIQVLRMLTRLPHIQNAWLWGSHTVPNGSPAQPYIPDVDFNCALIAPPVSLPFDFASLPIGLDKTIHFFAMVPIYEEELNLSISKGIGELYDRFHREDISSVVDPTRKNVAKFSWWPFG